MACVLLTQFLQYNPAYLIKPLNPLAAHVGDDYRILQIMIESM
jgi:hypothetical protein